MIECGELQKIAARSGDDGRAGLAVARETEASPDTRRGPRLATDGYRFLVHSRDFRHVRRNSTLVFLLGGLLAFAGVASCGHAASEQKASYGTRVKYRADQKIEFPHFTVEYIGERRKSLPVYPRGFLYYDFKVSSGKTEKVISWTTGTGVIVSTNFEIDGRRYQLELRHSDKLGKLNDNELVIWQAMPPS